MDEMMPQNFDPNPADPIVLFEQKYVVQPHPQAPSIAYRQKAGRARVYQLRNGQGQYFALKEFKKLYRTPDLIDSYRNLHRVESFEGLRAANRRIVLPDDPAAQRHSNLQYAMLMPWIHGTTWFDVLGQAREDGDYPDLTIAIDLCDRFLEIMEGLEKAGMAHTDISPGNVMVGFDPIEVELVDLEDMYMPGADAPPQQTTGSTGYQHRSGETTWKPQGDRYAAAVLAAEMLILAKPELARKATDEGFFTNHCQTPEGIARFREARPWLEEVAPEFARVFKRSWYADSLEGCPSISELREPIKELANRRLLTESPKRVETPISRQPSAESKAAGETPVTPVVGSGAPKRPPKRLIGAGLAVVALLVIAVGVGVWSTLYASTTPVAATSESTTPEAATPVSGEPSPQATTEEFTLASTLSGHSGPVRSVAFSPEGSLLASGSVDGTVKLWDPQSGEELRTLTGGGAPIAFSPDGSLLASGSKDGVKLWDPQSGEELRTLTGGGNSIAFSPDGRLLASSSRGTIKLWNPQSREELRTLSDGHPKGVAFSPDGSLLASGSGGPWEGGDGTVKLWDPQSGELLQTLTGHSNGGGVQSVAFSPDGSLLASGSGDPPDTNNTVKLWDPQSGKELQTLSGHSGSVRSVAFSPDGKLLASTSGEGIKLWDPQSGEELQTLSGHSAHVNSVAFSPNGSLLASGGGDPGGDNTVRLWERAEDEQ